MILHDVIIVGSGPAGTAAALQLAGGDVLLLDAGFTPPEVPPNFCGDLYELRKTQLDLFPSLVGENYDSLANLFADRKINLKLKSPYMSYIIRNWQTLSSIDSSSFEAAVSLAKGGLANAWGAGVFRFTDEDLRDFPIGYAELEPFFDKLTAHVGISGDNDDLTPWFQRDKGLMPPIRLCGMAADLLERYTAARETFNSEGVFIGRTRLAVLTAEHRGRAPYAYEHMEFFRSDIEAVYSPAFTLDELVRDGLVDYRPGWLVERFEEIEGGVVGVCARPVEGGEPRFFRARKLLLGAGALNTARIVLASEGDTVTRLPIMDNPMSCFPVFRLDRLGRALDPEDASVGQLNIICQGVDGAGTVQASFYGTNGPLRTDVIFDLPLPAGAARTILKYTASATALTMLFYPGVVRPGNFLRLKDSGALEIVYESEPHTGMVERKLIRLLRKVGYYSHPALLKYLPMGNGLHYAGTLPMRENPQRYQCHPDGRLSGTQNVYLIDGACFSALPAKNLTFTVMANAMRIACSAAGER
jgi:choline dehydrogenase-like flavoprotein